MCLPMSTANIIIDSLNYATNTKNKFPVSEHEVDTMTEKNIPWFYTVYYNMDYNETVYYIRDSNVAVLFGLMGFKNEKNG